MLNLWSKLSLIIQLNVNIWLKGSVKLLLSHSIKSFRWRNANRTLSKIVKLSLKLSQEISVRGFVDTHWKWLIVRRQLTMPRMNFVSQIMKLSVLKNYLKKRLDKSLNFFFMKRTFLRNLQQAVARYLVHSARQDTPSVELKYLMKSAEIIKWWWWIRDQRRSVLFAQWTGNTRVSLDFVTIQTFDLIFRLWLGLWQFTNLFSWCQVLARVWRGSSPGSCWRVSQCSQRSLSRGTSHAQDNSQTQS